MSVTSLIGTQFHTRDEEREREKAHKRVVSMSPKSSKLQVHKPGHKIRLISEFPNIRCGFRKTCQQWTIRSLVEAMYLLVACHAAGSGGIQGVSIAEIDINTRRAKYDQRQQNAERGSVLKTMQQLCANSSRKDSWLKRLTIVLFKAARHCI